MENVTWQEPDPRTVSLCERRLMGAMLGLDEGDPAIEELYTSGLRPSTVALLELLPLVEIVWADGSVSPRERQIVTAAAARRRDVGGSAHTQLATWLTERPSEQIFRACRNTLRRVIHDLARSAAVQIRSTLETETALLMSSGGGLLGGDAPAPEAQRRVLERLFAEIGVNASVQPGGTGGLQPC